MRLINYGVGEIADRLTILSLKILYGTEAAKDTKHFLDERNALLAQLRSRELNGGWFEHVLELAAVNGRLWQSEDDLRGMRTAKLADGYAAELAFRIQGLNDRRAELVNLINKVTGEHRGDEKL
jgi:hypothetical protein